MRKYLPFTMVLILALLPAAASGATKMEICHLPPDNPGNPQTLMVDDSAVADHLAHGDTIGACAVQAPVAYSCQVLSAGPFTRLFVRAGASGRRDGSPEDPFDSIASALAHATHEDLPAVELQIAPGVYAGEDVVVSQDTRIVGPGLDSVPPAELALSLINSGAHTLEVQGILFSDSTSSDAGSITVAHDDAATALCDVLFDGVESHAVSQVGGWLKMVDLSIQSTHSSPQASGDPFVSGTGIHLSGGVEAVLRHLVIEGTEGSALIAEGADTKVLVSYSLDADGGQSRSAITASAGCYGAILVRDDALFLGESLDLGGSEDASVLLEEDANLIRGLTVLDDARAHVRDSFIGNTRTDDTAVERCGSPWSTIGAAVSSASLVMTDFILTDSDQVGAGIFQGGLATFYGSPEEPSIVRNNHIGVAISGTVIDLACLQDYVLWVNNDVNIDTDVISVPPPPVCYDEQGNIIECPPEPPVCVEVAFDPYWDTEAGP